MSTVEKIIKWTALTAAAICLVWIWFDQDTPQCETSAQVWIHGQCEEAP